MTAATYERAMITSRDVKRGLFHTHRVALLVARSRAALTGKRYAALRIQPHPDGYRWIVVDAELTSEQIWQSYGVLLAAEPTTGATW